MGLKVCLADLSQQALDLAVADVAAVSLDGRSAVMGMPVDVSNLDDITRLRDAAYGAFGEVGVLMNNAGTAPGGGPWEHIHRWRHVLEVNLWGVINGVQSFTPRMLEQGMPCAIINTGSKQGITCPPGDTAYNVSKAGVKVLTEALAHSLRNVEGARITAHLLIPGSTFTGMTSRGRSEKPPAAWMPDQVVEMLVEGMNRGDFYILCPRQRGDPGDRQPAYPLGGAGHHAEPSCPVAMASRFHRGIRGVSSRRAERRHLIMRNAA
jgi:NAD(P)-dependent dehydrogenase (short-subunit alcohol dehydrogenase family)